MEFQQVQDIKLLILTIGVFLGVTLSTFLILNKSAKNKANIYLGLLVFSSTLFFFPSFFARLGILEYFPHVVGIPRVSPFLFGPLTFLYVRACTQKGFKMRPILWLHFIPAFLMLLHCMPELLVSGAQKVINQANFTRTGNLDYAWIWLLKVIHPMIYFGFSVKKIFLYRKHVSNFSSTIDSAFHRWLLIFIFILALPILGLLSLVFLPFNSLSLVFLVLGLVTFLIAIYIATLVKPELFHAFPHQMDIPESSEEQKQKYENSTLQEAQKIKYVEKLTAFMDAEKPYLEPELTLAQIAEQVKIPAHSVSQIINEKLDVNFLDFINGYRVKEAQAKLVDPKFDHYTIISIAYEAGFNSKSTFYTAFKKQTGMTPSKYRKELKAA